MMWKILKVGIFAGGGDAVGNFNRNAAVAEDSNDYINFIDPSFLISSILLLTDNGRSTSRHFSKMA